METRPAPNAWLRGAGLWLLVCLGVIFLYLMFMARNVDAITDIDALDNAQIARNLAEGKGFTSDFIKPLCLTKVTALDHHADLIFSPLHPWFTSMVMRVVGATKFGIAFGSLLPFLFTLLLVYLLGMRLFDQRTGILAAALLGLNLWVVRYSVSGLEVCLLGLLVTALFMVLHRIGESEETNLAQVAVAGLLVGALALTKDVWGLILLPTALFLWLTVDKRQRWIVLGVFVGLFVVAIIPWCLRQAHYTGNPFFSWRWYETEMETITNPGNTLYRSFRPDVANPIAFVFAHPLEMYEKIRLGASSLYGILTYVGGAFVLPFFVVAILVVMGNSTLERMRYLLYLTYGLVFVAVCFIMPSPRMFYPFAPMISIIAAAFFLRVFTPLLRRYGPREQARLNGLGLAAIILIQGFPLLLNITARQEAGRSSSIGGAEKLALQVAEVTTGPIITDVPWLTSWYGHQTSIWLPRSWDDLERMQLSIGQVQYLLLTPTVAQWEGAERTAEWIRLWSAAQAGRPVAYRGFVVYKLLGDNWILFRKAAELPGRTGASSEVPNAPAG
ncbi:MAG TPA: glycosyltransferase family 39 protein [Armatimonadota bacterium]